MVSIKIADATIVANKKLVSKKTGKEFYAVSFETPLNPAMPITLSCNSYFASVMPGDVLSLVILLDNYNNARLALSLPDILPDK